MIGDKNDGITGMVLLFSSGKEEPFVVKKYV